MAAFLFASALKLNICVNDVTGVDSTNGYGIHYVCVSVNKIRGTKAQCE